MLMLLLLSTLGGGRKGKGGLGRSSAEHQRDLHLVSCGSKEEIIARLMSLFPQVTCRIRRDHQWLSIEDTEDIMMKALAEIMFPKSETGGIRGFRGNCSLSTWFSGIVGRRVIDHYRYVTRQRRDRRNEVSVDELDRSLPDGGSLPEEIAESREVFAAAMARLNAKEREVIQLCDIEGLSQPEAAEVLGIRKGTVNSRLTRARDRLMGDRDLRSYYLNEESASGH